MTTAGKKIKAAMAIKGITETEIARQEGVTVSAICHVICGRKTLSRLREAISLSLDIPSNIWTQMDRERKALKDAKL